MGGPLCVWSGAVTTVTTTYLEKTNAGKDSEDERKESGEEGEAIQCFVFPESHSSIARRFGEGTNKVNKLGTTTPGIFLYISFHEVGMAFIR